MKTPRRALLLKALGHAVRYCSCGRPWLERPMGDHQICRCGEKLVIDGFQRGLYFGALDMLTVLEQADVLELLPEFIATAALRGVRQ